MRRIAGAIAVWLLTTPAAFAADVALADIFSGDGDPQSNEFFHMIFGPLFPVLGGGADATLISNLMTTFNVLFFAVGMLLLVYNIIVGVAETAHTGSVLGTRHSAMWAPIRAVVAAGMLIPLPSGYNGVQHGIAYVVNAGTAAASLIWDKTVTDVIDQRMPVASPDYARMDAQFVQAVWGMELCRAAYNQEVAKGGDLEKMTAGWDGNKPGSYLYSITSRQGACGKISLPGKTKGFERIAKANGLTYDQWHAAMKAAVSTFVGSLRPKAEAVAKSASDRTPMPATENLSKDLSDWRDLHTLAVAPFINQLKENKNQSLTKSFVNSKPDDDDLLAKNLTHGGWTQAGFYYQTLARFSSDAASVAHMVPLTSPGDAIGASTNPHGSTFGAVRSQAGSWWNPFSSADGTAKELLSELTNTYNLSVNWWNESVARSNIRAFTNQREVFADNGGDISNFMPSMSSMQHAYDNLNPAGGREPILGLVQLGQGIVTVCTTVIAGLGVLSMTPFVGDVANYIASMVGWIISGVAVIGAFMAFILPMVPTAIWVINVTAFFLLVVEAVFAGPLWAIAHLSMDDQGLSGRGARKGYVFVLSLLLTPVLMLFGLLVGMIIFRIAATLINGGFYYALTSAASLNGASWTSVSWFIGTAVVMLFMAVVYVIIMERSFSLIAEFPGRVLRWFDEVGNDLDYGTADRARAAGLVTGAATAGVLPSVGKGVQGRIEGKVAQRDRDRQQKIQRDKDDGSTSA